jgi:hypothetical protein
MTTEFVLGLVTAWVLSGLVAGFVMRRLGHDFFVWFALGSVIGPPRLPTGHPKGASRSGPRH